MKLAEQALIYLEEMGFSIIPLKKDKTPYIRWFDYKDKKPTSKEVRDWWTRWPNANIGIATGKISGVDVIDCDTEAGKDALNEYLPESFLTPISKTPHGWHYYFEHKPGLTNQVRGGIKDCDIRTTGGYAIAPPSKNGHGSGYEWEIDIKETQPEPMPDILFDILEQCCFASEPSSSHINKEENSLYMRGQENTCVSKAHQSASERNITFSEPGRDDTLFHLANYLVKSSMPQVSIEKYLQFIGQNCKPPFPEKELSIKIQSAFQRSKRKNTGLKDELLDLISASSGIISASNCYNALQCASRNEKSAVRTVLSRLVNDGLLEKSGRKAGEYRIIDGNCESENWQDAEVKNVKLWLPFELDAMIDVPAGSIILFAGSQDAGKSAVMMNIAKENRHKWNTHYFSSELSAASFKNRMSKFDDVSVDMLSDINFYQRGHSFEDVIKTGDKDLNIIDYLEIHDSFFKVAEYFDNIYRKLKGRGVAVIAIQKDPHKEYGRGGSFAEEKPILSVALDTGGIATINKFKGEFRESNPRGKQYKYKILNGSKLVMVQHWHVPITVK